MIGKRIRELRLAGGLTLKEVAGFLGYSESFLSLVESGVRNISSRDLEKLAKYFNVKYSFFTLIPDSVHERTEGNTRISSLEEDKIAKDFLDYVKKIKRSE